MVSPRNPLNIGAAARAMSNFGFSCLRVVNPYEVAFREARSAVGAAELLACAEEFSNVADAVSDCSLVIGTTAGRDRELHHQLKDIEAAAPLIREQLVAGRVALLFGSEKRGLSNQDLSYCHWLMHIPTRDEHSSMNLGQSVAVCLYELARGVRTAPEPEPTPVASGADLDRITALLLDTLRTSGYVDARAGTTTEERVRRMIHRMNISARDGEVWLGMLRKIQWKLKSADISSSEHNQ